MKVVSTIKYMNTSIIYYQNTNVNYVKVLAHNTVFMLWQKNGKNGRINGATLTDLSKAFDCILYDFLIGELAVYCFDYPSSEFIEIFFSKTQERKKIIIPLIMSSTRVNFGYLNFQYLHLAHTFWHNQCDILRYEHDNPQYDFDFSLDNVIINLEKYATFLKKWFR